ncbi:MAG TPA: PQQ-dependent sugar dehydrogenase [Vicinamibacterales bacterium]
MRTRIWLRAAPIVLAVLPALLVAQGRQEVVQSRTGGVRVEKLATLEFPWGMDYLPDGRLLITEKPGRLRIFANGELSEPLEGVPHVSYKAGQTEQGGLLDVAVDPDFANSRTIFLSYTEEAPQTSAPAKPEIDPRVAGGIDPQDARLRGGVVARAILDGNRLADVQPIWKQEPKTVARGHFGHRIVFAPDGTMFVTSGDRMRFDPAQDLGTNLGKVVRITREGTAPKDNPFVDKEGARDEIWTYGHRNMLAAAMHPTSGQLWVFEMGPFGGDELNVIRRGRNYGWPLVSNGSHYNKEPIPDHATSAEYEPPIRTWTPVISPSGALFYDGDLFPWKGNAIIGGLSAQGLVRLVVDDDRVMDEDRIILKRRVRDVTQAPDGALLVITDHEDGELLRLTPDGT